MSYENNTGYPSVTDILSPYVDKRWFKEIHRVRGSEVHRVVTCKLVKSWAKPINPAWKGYVVSILRWCQENIKRVIMVETRFVDDLYKYTGKLDLVAELLDGRIGLGDFKTSVAAGKTWPLQTAGYKLLYEKNSPDLPKIDIRFGVRGREDGSKPALVNWYEDHQADETSFLYANHLYHNLML
jgi:hypothetical protein